MTTIDSALRAALVTLAIAVTPQFAAAAGLGPIKVFSSLGQNLRAEIEVNATAAELQTLSARIASADAFRQAGLPFTSTVAGIQLALDTRAERPLLRLSSTRPIDDPYVGLLVEIDWAAGNLAREYTFLLDPADLAPAQPATPAPQAATLAPPAVRAAPATAPAAAAPAPRPVASAPPAPRTHLVRRGETLHRIASANLPRGVTLDQMLIALHRANRDAFEGDNINRLLADQRLVLPDAAQARALSAAEARTAVRAQAADFQAYRRALASAAASRAPVRAATAAQQSSSGRIVPRVEEATASGDVQDRVQVSRNREALSPQGDARLQALEEELAARERALEDSNERLDQLEQAVRDLQKLLELRATLPGQPAVADAAPAEAAPAVLPPAEPPAEPPTPEAEAPPPALEPEAPPAPPESPAVEDETGVLQRLVEQPVLAAGLGGLAALLLLGLGFVLGRLGRKSTPVLVTPAPAELHQTAFARTGGQDVDTSNALPAGLTQAGMSALEDSDGVDPVAEADVYMAYGRDVQAEEILRDALAVDPERAAIYLKLLEIHAQRGEAAPFEAVARVLHERTGGLGWDWDKAAAMGRKLDPGNPLYALRDTDSDTLAPGTEVPTAVMDPAIAAGLAAAAAHTMASPAAAEEEAPAREDVVHTLSDLDFTSSRVEQPLATSAPSTVLGGDALDEPGTAEIDEIDLDLDGDDDFAAPPATQAPAEPAAQERNRDALLDFDLGDDDAPPSQPPAAVASELPALADELDFELPDLELDTPAREFDLSATMVEAANPAAAESPAADAPAAAGVEGGLLDFDFDIESAAPLTIAPAMPTPAPAAPALAGGVDLSNISLDLDGIPEAPAAAPTPTPEKVARAAAAAAAPGARKAGTAARASEPGLDAPTQAPPADAIAQAAQDAADALDAAVAEVDTKLELAQAYEEMGDREGALELIEEIVGEGTAEQVVAALAMKKRLG